MHCVFFEGEAKSQQIPLTDKVQSLHPAGKALGTTQLRQPSPGTGFLHRHLLAGAGEDLWGEGACGVNAVGPLVSGPSDPVSSALRDAWWVSTLQQRPSYMSINELLNMMFRDIFPLKNNPQVHEKESAPS